MIREERGHDLVQHALTKQRRCDAIECRNYECWQDTQRQTAKRQETHGHAHTEGCLVGRCCFLTARQGKESHSACTHKCGDGNSCCECHYASRDSHDHFGQCVRNGKALQQRFQEHPLADVTIEG